jgi:uncharacterized RmlC-like cupin family protein
MLTELVSTDGLRAGANPKGYVVKAGARYRSEQGSDYDPGVSAETVGSKVLFLGVVTLPPGARTRAHVHERHETALYVVSGEIEIWTGDQLQHREIAAPGDYIYVPANVLHVGVNRGSEPAGLHRHPQRTDRSGEPSAVSGNGCAGAVTTRMDHAAIPVLLWSCCSGANV